ncbi:hypothetical protein LCGC14_1121120 [marine sediment metagenome]|uniref:Uncharacterized protein n=1 Tax=marine sediment metagenome TaxID=412755 RepID=A0A0F9M8Q5_9ZZZZ
MSRCLSCGGPDNFHEPHCQQERDSLRAENARLQAALEDARMLCMNDHAYDNETSQVFEAVQVINRALADPPAQEARKTVLVEALQALEWARPFDQWGHKDVCIRCGSWKELGRHQEGCPTAQALADVSPAAAALLAQGAKLERLGEGYARLLNAYKWSNKRDREKLIHEAELLLTDLKWGTAPIARAAPGEEKE